MRLYKLNLNFLLVSNCLDILDKPKPYGKFHMDNNMHNVFIYIIYFTCFETFPSLFLSILLNNFSSFDSSPRNSSNDKNPSKSLSLLRKKSSTSSLKIRNHRNQIILFLILILKVSLWLPTYFEVGTPEAFRILCHSSWLSFPSLFLSARSKYLRI